MEAVELETVEILPGIMLEAMLQKVQLPIRIRFFCAQWPLKTEL
jgi:glycerol-3-phosphate responsive antiterminator